MVLDEEEPKKGNDKLDSSGGLSEYSSVSKNESDLTRASEEEERVYPMDKKHNRYPYCIVWTPLPLITAILPCIGHTGICSAEGIIHDFGGSYFVGVDNMSFGNPYKYVLLNPSPEERKNWNRAIEKGDQRFNNEEHNLFTNNCHSHCAYVLNMMKYKGKSNYNMVDIFFMVNFKGRYVSYFSIFKTYIGFIILIAIILILNRLMK